MTTEQNMDSTLGDLKTARENSGLTLKDLFLRTRISVINLEAIENGDFHLLPVPIYTRNFIKTYADALGMDSKPVLERYENYLQSLQIKEKAEAQQQSQQTSWASNLGRYKSYLWMAGIIIVFVAVSFFVTVLNKPEPEPVQKPETPQSNATSVLPAQDATGTKQPPVPVGIPKPDPSVAAPPESGEKKKPIATTENPVKSNAASQSSSTRTQAPAGEDEQSVLVVRATEETWIRFQIDDKEPFQVLLQPGEKIARKAASFKIDIGNAGGIAIQLNGKNIENLGKSGEVIHLTLP